MATKDMLLVDASESKHVQRSGEVMSSQKTNDDDKIANQRLSQRMPSLEDDNLVLDSYLPREEWNLSHV